MNIKRLFLSPGEPIKPWWLTVVGYVVAGILMVIAGIITATEKTIIPAVCPGILFILVGVLLLIAELHLKKK
jgi:uncharacterized membrane protein HdeD (DUF308 family)